MKNFCVSQIGKLILGYWLLTSDLVCPATKQPKLLPAYFFEHEIIPKFWTRDSQKVPMEYLVMPSMTYDAKKIFAP